ncbi:MAG: threonine/serine exporter family protein [Schaedlerella sp.]|nr:threonine/serine exporter family protein [Schaedlerella sp.]
MTLLLEIFVAAVGTIAFSVLFGVPARFYPYCGLIGGIGWGIYSLIEADGSVVAASFVATFVVVFLSRFAAVLQHCPVSVFLVSGIFPLVPGASVYWTAYYLVTDQVMLGLERGYLAVKIAFAIVLGIVCVFEIPQKFFAKMCGRRKN